MPLRLAFSSNAYLDVPVEQAIERIAGFGYSGIELLADVPHAWPAGLLEVQKESIRRALRESGLVVSNINAFMMNAIADPRQPYWHPGWTDPDPHYRAIRREHTKRALRGHCGSLPTLGQSRSRRSPAARSSRARPASRRPTSSTTRSCRCSTWRPRWE